MVNILLIEDEPNVISLIQRGLHAEEYAVSVAMDGPSGLEAFRRQAYGLVILDIMLPGMNGLDVCRAIRQADAHTPVLILSALGTTEDIVTGLDTLADDYLVKPFKLAELSARIRTLTRRATKPQAPQNALRLADLVVDLDKKSVWRASKSIVLTATEFRLLECLLRSRGNVLSRVQILEEVWGIDFNMGTNVVDVYINYLRKKIDKHFTPRLIHTVIGMGYAMREQYHEDPV
ncbi:response regulator transcription factor [Chitinophaga sp.]|uniref:response regulator transcription factor n=1 Tax=Chitinophaga sp. TaxID=1869181 RepID=UPI0026093694|nr:response regulator transcription factor [uncultured Chitinophaga sp.]